MALPRYSAPASLLANLLIFARTLRAAGVAVRAGGVPDAVRALADVGISTPARRARRASRRARLPPRRSGADSIALFERFWRVWPGARRPGLPRPMQHAKRARTTFSCSLRARRRRSPADRHGAGATCPSTLQTYSADEAWRRKGLRRVHRSRRGARPGSDRHARLESRVARDEALDRRRAAARSICAACFAPTRGTGESRSRFRIASAACAPRPLILICDVSGSMEPYTRMLLLFAHAMAPEAAPRRGVRVFDAAHEGHAAVRRRQRRTRRCCVCATPCATGPAARASARPCSTFNTRWARRVLRRGPVVLLISDGWDLGDPDLLGERSRPAATQRAPAHLAEPADRIAGYEPLTRGIRAALPFVDDFLSVRNMSSLEALARHLNTLE